jgi:hypothetical protein
MYSGCNRRYVPRAGSRFIPINYVGDRNCVAWGQRPYNTQEELQFGGHYDGWAKPKRRPLVRVDCKAYPDMQKKLTYENGFIGVHVENLSDQLNEFCKKSGRAFPTIDHDIHRTYGWYAVCWFDGKVFTGDHTHPGTSNSFNYRERYKSRHDCIRKIVQEILDCKEYQVDIAEKFRIQNQQALVPISSKEHPRLKSYVDYTTQSNGCVLIVDDENVHQHENLDRVFGSIFQICSVVSLNYRGKYQTGNRVVMPLYAKNAADAQIIVITRQLLFLGFSVGIFTKDKFARNFIRECPIWTNIFNVTSIADLRFMFQI